MAIVGHGRCGGTVKKLLLTLAALFLFSAIGASAAPRRSQKDLDGHAVWLVDSCAELTELRTTLEGILIITGEVLCQDLRVIEAKEDLTITSDQKVLHTKGIRFHVPKDMAMHIGAASMLFETIEGGIEEVFTVEPEAFLGWQADDVGPALEGGVKEDINSLVRVQNGGTFEMDRTSVWYTGSSIAVTQKPMKKDQMWITYQVRFNQRQRWREMNGGGGGSGPADPATAWPFPSPFTPEASAKDTFHERLTMSPSYLKVGEELRYPSSMTAAAGGSVMSLGVDGTLLHASRKRQKHFAKEMKAAAAAAATTTTTTTTTMAADYDGDDADLKLTTLVKADPIKAKMALMGRHRVNEGGIPSDTAADGTGEEKMGEASPTTTGFNPAFEEYLRSEKARLHHEWGAREKDGETTENSAGAGDGGGGGGGRRQGAEETNKTCGDNPTAASDGSCASEEKDGSPTHAGGGGGGGGGGDSQETKEADKANTSKEPTGHWGDDVTLRLTDTGSVVVTVGGHVVVEKHNPNTTKKQGWIKTKLRKMNPVKKIKNVFRRSRSRDSTSTGNNSKDAVVSTQYTLHVVAKGFEVRLAGGFVWGWDATSS